MQPPAEHIGHRLPLGAAAAPALTSARRDAMGQNVSVDLGWGRLIFGHTFATNEAIVETLCAESRGKRDIAIYLRDPHVLLAMAPDRLFLDPSHTYRVLSARYAPPESSEAGFTVRVVETLADVEAINRIYATRNMVSSDPSFVLDQLGEPTRMYLLAEDVRTGEVLGAVMGVDHVRAFGDPENGGSLWCLAVDPQCHVPGVGEGLVRRLVEDLFARGRAYVDLSVMHDNEQAIALYEKLGFQRIPVFCVKHKNPINEPLFMVPEPTKQLNIYAKIIVDEARRRGIRVDVLDVEAGYFRLSSAGRSIVCRESLSELTSSIAMSRCDDKRVTRRLMEGAGLRVPAQRGVTDDTGDEKFLAEHGSIVVKPARGEQGMGISVDIRAVEEMRAGIEAAKRVSADVVLEEFVAGEDLRVVVIDGEVVAAAVRRPPTVIGTGEHTVRELIEKYNRRRAAATEGESRVPFDEETTRCVRLAGHKLDDVLPTGKAIDVRRTANLHTGGTIHDVTAQLHPALAEASIVATRAIEIPVAGLDLIVPAVDGPTYWLIEVNERVGLANHEPQPTAERFVDFLFPSTTHRPRSR